MNIKLISAQLSMYDRERLSICDIYSSFKLYLLMLISDARHQLIGKKIKVHSTGKIYKIIGVGVGGSYVTFNCMNDEFYITVTPDEIELV